VTCSDVRLLSKVTSGFPHTRRLIYPKTHGRRRPHHARHDTRHASLAYAQPYTLRRRGWSARGGLCSGPVCTGEARRGEAAHERGSHRKGEVSERDVVQGEAANPATVCDVALSRTRRTVLLPSLPSSPRRQKTFSMPSLSNKYSKSYSDKRPSGWQGASDPARSQARRPQA